MYYCIICEQNFDDYVEFITHIHQDKIESSVLIHEISNYERKQPGFVEHD
jgi:hypothetical protein